MTKPIYVFVNGGNVDACLDAEGNPVGVARIIDYDNAATGICPVCGEELELIGAKPMKGFPGATTGGHDFCAACGYDESKDNALACAVAYYAADNEALHG